MTSSQCGLIPTGKAKFSSTTTMWDQVPLPTTRDYMRLGDNLPSTTLPIAQSDYRLFRSLINHLAGEKFKNNDDVESELLVFFQSKPASFCRDGTTGLHNRWLKVDA
ncbi:hypothetical protein M514_08399 [Trichuris suis]|uniref:Uncharacterized protein n=1 Tax=Trichuris suis TaxID=68888 RepID=A0A085M0J7_9BILA|nr:hypothetical protein M513_08399 [Trichuris suis]KFD63146.1 hypothetical protein M514_08399 [Trichuris suis]